MTQVYRAVLEGWKSSPRLFFYSCKELTMHEGYIIWDIRVIMSPRKLHISYLQIIKMKALTRSFIYKVPMIFFSKYCR